MSSDAPDAPVPLQYAVTKRRRWKKPWLIGIVIFAFFGGISIGNAILVKWEQWKYPPIRPSPVIDSGFSFSGNFRAKGYVALESGNSSFSGDVFDRNLRCEIFRRDTGDPKETAVSPPQAK